MEDLPWGWTKENVRLAHRIMLRKLTPAALEKMCPTTQSLSETIAVVVEESDGAANFVLALRDAQFRFHFANLDSCVTVS